MRWTPSQRSCSSAVGLDVPVRRRVDSLSVAQRQMIEIAKALGREPLVLILDEPTSALGPAESERVLELARRHASDRRNRHLRRSPAERSACGRRPRGRSPQRPSGLRPHTCRGDRGAAHPRHGLARICCPRARSQRPERAPRVRGAAARGGRPRPARPHGPAGRGRRRRRTHGLGTKPPAACRDGRAPGDEGRDATRRVFVPAASAADGAAAGIGLVPEDRKSQGLLVDASIRWNVTLAILRRISWRRVRPRAENRPPAGRRDRGAGAGSLPFA